jgi:hypothetical protein
MIVDKMPIRLIAREILPFVLAASISPSSALELDSTENIMAIIPVKKSKSYA